METEHSYVAADGTRLAYRLRRRGDTDTALVMLHGLASNMSRWRELSESLKLNQPWDLLRMDLRGHGNSMFRGRIGHAVWAEDLHALLDHAGYSKAILLGHSLGAQLALHFAHRFPDLGAGIIMIDPVLPECLQGKLARVARLRALLPPVIQLMWLLNKAGIRRRRFKKLDLYTLDRSTRELLRNQPDTAIDQLYAQPLSDLTHLPTANYLQDLYEVTRPLPPLTSIKAAVLILLSKGVSLSSLTKTQSRLAQLPRAEIELIDADHWLLTERPDEARAAIEQWCNRLAVKPK